MSDDKEALAAYLRERGVLYASATQAIRHRDGALAPWAFYSWNATLTEKGLRLAALCILETLREKGFRATQLASIGYTGMPLLSACIMLGGGRYTGLCIREQRKAYLSCRRVEGPFDKSAPVVVIDDSISSGTSLQKAIRAIEEEGAEVEGAVALVQFPHRGGLDWANERGYRTEAILDIWSDLGMASTLAPPPPRMLAPAGNVVAPEGLHPALLARFTAATYLATGVAPLPPTTMDRPYACPGGVFVSFRERENENRIARAGFWHFDPTQAQPCVDVIAATIDTLQAADGQISLRNLQRLKIAVTFLSALEPIAPSGLDFDRYGIVAQSKVYPHKRGGALPNTQVFVSDIEQYRQARETNAGIAPGEPHQLYRHDVFKHVEPGTSWLPYGTPEDGETAWWRDSVLGSWLIAQARALLRQLKHGGAEPPTLPENSIGCEIAGVAVRLYRAGLAGYGFASGVALNAALNEAVRQAVNDPRLAESPEQCVVVVSILHHPEPLGNASIAAVARKLRRGLDALAVTYAGRSATLLPSVLPYNNLTREDLVRTAARCINAEQEAEAGMVEWRTFQCAEWADSGGRVHALRFGFPDRSDSEQPADAKQLIRLLAGHIAASIDSDGVPRYLLLPIGGEVQRRGTAGRAIHALMALDLAAEFLNVESWREMALRGLRYCLTHVSGGTIMLPGCAGGGLADAVLLSAIATHPELAVTMAARGLALRLGRLLRPDGRIGDLPKLLDRPEDQEFLPGATLAAVAGFAYHNQNALPDTIAAQLNWYGHRFAACPGWGSVGWLPQGMQALQRLSNDPEIARLAFAATDWGLERQLERSGAFLEDLSPDEPSFNTGFIAEGVVASWAIALHIGERERAERYARSWSEAMRFMQRLIVFPEDVFAMSNGAAALGGVRCTQSRTDIRIDQVSHCLHALVEGARLERLMRRLSDAA